MEDPGGPRRWTPAAWMTACAVVGLSGALAAQPAAVQPRLHVSFPSPHADRMELAAAVPLDETMWVTVVIPGAKPDQAALTATTAGTTLKMVGHDPISRLGFLRVTGREAETRGTVWLNRVASPAGEALFAMSPAGRLQGRSQGWVQQIGGKILPLALLRVSFDRAAPAPGTALTDAQGRVAAVFFQPGGGVNAGYAIPAEAVHRVWRDISAHGRLQRGWIGLSLHAERQAPQVVRVLPDSPAAKAGVLPDDILTHIGGRAISSYADAVNAFFYLIPGKPVGIKVLRGTVAREFTLTPVVPAAG